MPLWKSEREQVAEFVFPDWDAVAARNEAVGPTGDELWVLNGRVNALWNNLFDYVRRELAIERWPENFLEISEEDAAARGISNGDLLRIESDNVLDQLGQATSGGFEAVAYVSPTVPPASRSRTSCTRALRRTRSRVATRACSRSTFATTSSSERSASPRSGRPTWPRRCRSQRATWSRRPVGH